MKSLGLYILRGKTPVRCKSSLAWVKWLGSADRHVRLTRVGPYMISTVFLGINHGFFRNGLLPILFETMAWLDLPKQLVEAVRLELIFTDECKRCSTWEEAEIQHEKMIERLKRPEDAVEELVHGETKKHALP